MCGLLSCGVECSTVTSYWEGILGRCRVGKGLMLTLFRGHSFNGRYITEINGSIIVLVSAHSSLTELY